MTISALATVAEAKAYAEFLLRFANLSERQLAEDIERQRSIVFTLIQLAQSLNHLPPEVMGLAPEIPFQAIKGMRNRLVHGYAQTDFTIIAGVLNRRISELIVRLDELTTLLSARDLK